MSGRDSWDVLVRRDDPAVTQVRTGATGPLGSGQVRLAVEKFALTANNATYARLGDSELPFFNAFPAANGYARVPIWGYARVEASRHPDVAVGTRYFGFLPMSSHHTTSVRVTDGGLVDAVSHREFLHDWYRSYPSGEPADQLDDLRTLIRPLYPASFALADFLTQHAETGVRRAVVTSASSRTALGLAERLRGGPRLELVALTAEAHRDFVARLDVYDRVLTYDALATLATEPETVLVDFTGQSGVLAAVCGHLATCLVHTSLVGYTHPGAAIEPPPVPGPPPEIFFTPDVEQQAMSLEGVDHYRARYREAEERYLRATASWFTVTRRRGPQQAATTLRELLHGEASPQIATVVLP